MAIRRRKERREKRCPQLSPLRILLFSGHGHTGERQSAPPGDRRYVSAPQEKPLLLSFEAHDPPEPVLTPSRDNPNAPDYLATHFYGTVIHDGDKFRMWYYSASLGRNPDWPAEFKNNFRPNPSVTRNMARSVTPKAMMASIGSNRIWASCSGKAAGRTMRSFFPIQTPLVHSSSKTKVIPIQVVDTKWCMNTLGKVPPNSTQGKVGLCAMPGVRTASIGRQDRVGWFKAKLNRQASISITASILLVGTRSEETMRRGGRQRSGTGGLCANLDGFSEVPPRTHRVFHPARTQDPKLRSNNGEYDQVHLGVGATGFGT